MTSMTLLKTIISHGFAPMAILKILFVYKEKYDKILVDIGNHIIFIRVHN